MNNFTLITKPGLGSIKDPIKNSKYCQFFILKKVIMSYSENLKNFKIIKELIKDNYSN